MSPIVEVHALPLHHCIDFQSSADLSYQININMDIFSNHSATLHSQKGSLHKMFDNHIKYYLNCVIIAGKYFSDPIINVLFYFSESGSKVTYNLNVLYSLQGQIQNTYETHSHKNNAGQFLLGISWRGPKKNGFQWHHLWKIWNLCTTQNTLPIG